MMKQGTKIILAAVIAGVIACGVWWLAAVRTVPGVPSVDGGVEQVREPLPEDIVGERMADTNYVAALKGLIDERREVIAESQAVRAQMGEMLAAAEKIVPGASSSGAEKVEGASSSHAEPLQDREQEAPATLVTNTALQAGTVLDAPEVPPAARFDDIPPALLEYVRQQPEWGTLETRLNALAARQQGIQIRTTTLIRERMEEQYAARAAENTAPIMRPPARVIKPMTNAPDFKAVEPIILTNVPPGGVRLPPLPDRRPVE